MKKIPVLFLLMVAVFFAAQALSAEESKKDEQIPVSVAGAAVPEPDDYDASASLPGQILSMPLEDAFQRMQRMQKALSDINDDFQKGFSEGWNRYSGGPNFRPAIDAMETPEEVIITCDMPGVEKKDIQLEIQGNVLYLRGSRGITREEAANEKNLRFSRRERSYGSFVRTLRIPEAVDPSRVSAEFKDGILTVRLPKAKKDQPIQIKVE